MLPHHGSMHPCISSCRLTARLHAVTLESSTLRRIDPAITATLARRRLPFQSERGNVYFLFHHTS
jgi:hypothetical protein